MSVLFHSLVSLTYIALGATAAFGLPLASAAIEPALAFFVGGAVLFGGALVHQSIVNSNRGRDIMREIEVVSLSNEAMQRDLEATRNELHEIKEQIGEDKQLGGSGLVLEDNMRSSNEVLGELRMLRTLFAQLISKKGGKKSAQAQTAKTPPGKSKTAAQSDQDNIVEQAEQKSARALTPPAPSIPVAPPIPPIPVTADGTNGPVRLGQAPETSDAKSAYRASYMGLSSTLQPGETTNLVSFPPSQSQKAQAPEAFGSSAQDILTITRDALERARVNLFLQPIVSLPTRKVEYYEAYSRIQDHAGNFIGPHQYLELAERAGLVGAIDNNLLFRCIQLLRRVRRHNRDYGFFCNVSPHTLRDEAFFGQFIEFLSDNVELANDLIFEFSQADVETHYHEFADNLDRLAELGFSFSIDRVERLDLNFSEIAKRNFHYVKIEADNLISLAGTEKGLDQLHIMQEDLYDSRVTMIVEKIETEPQLVELLDHNIRYGQGYLFGEPRESKT